MKSLTALLLASQIALPVAAATPSAAEPAPATGTAVTVEATPTTATDTPAVDNTVNGHPQYQTRQAIGKVLGCRDNPRYPWCWR